MKKLTTLLAIGMIISTVMPAVGQDKVNPPKSKKELVLKTVANSYEQRTKVGHTLVKINGSHEARKQISAITQELRTIPARQQDAFVKSLMDLNSIKNQKEHSKTAYEVFQEYDIDLPPSRTKWRVRIKVRFRPLEIEILFEKP